MGPIQINLSDGSKTVRNKDEHFATSGQSSASKVPNDLSRESQGVEQSKLVLLQ